MTPGRDQRSVPTWALPSKPSPFRVLRHGGGGPDAVGAWAGPRPRARPCRRCPRGSSPHQRGDPLLRSSGRMWSHLDWPGVCAGPSARGPVSRAPPPQPCARILADTETRGAPASAAAPRVRSTRRGRRPPRCHFGRPSPPAGPGIWRSASPRPPSFRALSTAPRLTGPQVCAHLRRDLCVRRYSESVREECGCTTTDLLAASLRLVGASLEAGFASGRIQWMTSRPPGRP